MKSIDEGARKKIFKAKYQSETHLYVWVIMEYWHRVTVICLIILLCDNCVRTWPTQFICMSFFSCIVVSHSQHFRRTCKFNFIWQMKKNCFGAIEKWISFLLDCFIDQLLTLFFFSMLKNLILLYYVCQILFGMCVVVAFERAWF